LKRNNPINTILDQLASQQRQGEITVSTPGASVWFESANVPRSVPGLPPAPLAAQTYIVGRARTETELKLSAGNESEVIGPRQNPEQA
jgi:hypothetical protein